MGLKTKISLASLVGTILVVSFNNCSSSFQGQQGFKPSTKAGADLNSQIPTVDEDSVDDVGNGNQSTAPKLLVANSLQGPWVENGAICIDRNNYFKLVNVDVNDPTLKGCTDRNDGCFNQNNHRSFTENEKVGGAILVGLASTDSIKWPTGVYKFYLSRQSVFNGTEIFEVGRSAFHLCGGSAQTGSGGNASAGNTSPGKAVHCSWVRTEVEFGNIGSGITKTPSTTCDLGRKDRVENGYNYNNGVVTPKAFICSCQ